MKDEKKYTIDFRIWIYSNDEKLLGKGRIELLQNIQKFGSISKAAKEMKMSYRQAWQMVQEMNSRAKQSLIEKKLGGKEGGGATITTYGQQKIEQYLLFYKQINEFIQNLSID